MKIKLGTIVGIVFSILVIGSGNVKAQEVSTMPIPSEGKRARTLTGPDGTTHVIFNKMGNIYYTSKEASGTTFKEPIRVNSIEKSAAVGDIAIGGDGSVHVFFHGNIFYIRDQIKSENRKMRAPDIRYAFYSRLDPGSQSFSRQEEMADGVWGFDGGCTISADQRGNVYLFVGGTKQPGKEDTRRIYLRHSSDGGKSFSKSRAIDPKMGVCMCCHLKSSIGPNGEVLLAYRVAVKSVDRDSFVLVSKDQGQSFSKSALDKWKLRACPGSAYSFTSTEDSVFVSWRNQDDVYFRINDSDQFISPPGKEFKRRAAVLASNDKGHVVIAWAEGENFNKPHHLRWQVYDAQGNKVGDLGKKDGAFARWGNPAAFADKDGNFTVLY